jgi:hypothetical protein
MSDDLRLTLLAVVLLAAGCSSKSANVVWCSNWEDRYAGIQACASNAQCRLDASDMTLAKHYERSCSLETSRDH